MFHVVGRCTVYLKYKLCPDHPDPQNVKIIRKDTPDPQNVKVIKKDPHFKKQVKQIEGVQRRAARHKAIHGDSSPAFQTML